MSAFAQAPAAIQQPKEASMLDLAIVGAGPAGIATAYFLRDLGLDVTIFEAGDEVGGRTRTVPVGGIPSNTGALFVYRDTPAEELAAELGIRTAAFTPDTYGIHINNETVVDDDNHRLIDQLPISSTARDQLRAFVQTSVDEYESSHGPARSPTTPANWPA